MFDKNPTSSSKRSLILAGGGIRLAYQAGVLQALEEEALDFFHVDGTSGGIFNTAMLASDIEPNEMAERWRKLNVKNFISPRPFFNYFKWNKMAGLGDADGIRKKVFPALGIDIQKIRSDKKVISTFNVCNFSNKSIESIPNKDILEDHLIAGVSLPIFMPAININNQWYSDAVWIKDANLMEAVQRGAEEIWLVWAIGNDPEYSDGFFRQYVHMIEMSANGGLLEEYRQINQLNERIIKGDSPFGQQSPIKLHVIKPDFPLPLDPDLVFNKINTATLINMGYADTKKYLQSKSQNGIPLEMGSTKMKAPGTALKFRHHYFGQLDFNQKTTTVEFFPSFTYRRIDDDFYLFSNASINIHCLGREISTKNNLAQIKIINQSRFIQLTAEFENEGKTYQLEAYLGLDFLIDWYLGLAFKTVNITIKEKGNSNTTMLLKGELTQSIGARFRFLRSVYIPNLSGFFTKMKTKFLMISKLYSHEI